MQNKETLIETIKEIEDAALDVINSCKDTQEVSHNILKNWNQ